MATSYANERVARDMELTFKTQTDEWKSTLLNGADASAREKHWGGFHEREKQVAAVASKLQAAIDESTAKALIGKFALAHAEMGVGIAFWISRSVLRLLGGDPVEATRAAASIADGNLACDVPVRHGDQTSLMAALREMQARLATVVDGVRRHADGVAAGASHIASGSSHLNVRTEQQTSALQQTAASMEQLSGTVRQNADSARLASKLAADASSVAQQTGTVVAEVVSTMKGIAAGSAACLGSRGVQARARCRAGHFLSFSIPVITDAMPCWNSTKLSSSLP